MVLSTKQMQRLQMAFRLTTARTLTRKPVLPVEATGGPRPATRLPIRWWRSLDFAGLPQPALSLAPSPCREEHVSRCEITFRFEHVPRPIAYRLEAHAIICCFRRCSLRIKRSCACGLSGLRLCFAATCHGEQRTGRGAPASRLDPAPYSIFGIGAAAGSGAPPHHPPALPEPDPTCLPAHAASLPAYSQHAHACPLSCTYACVRSLPANAVRCIRADGVGSLHTPSRLAYFDGIRRAAPLRALGWSTPGSREAPLAPAELAADAKDGCGACAPTLISFTGRNGHAEALLCVVCV